MRITHLLCLVCLAALAGGCWETKQTITMNPDGSGKVVFDTVTALPINPMGGGKEQAFDPQAETRKAVGKMLSDSKGVDAWSDVSFAVLPDGRIEVKGVAFFGNVANLKMPWGNDNLKWEKTDKGMALTVGVEAAPPQGERRPEAPAAAPPTAKLTPEEAQKKVLAERMKYRQGRPMLVAFLDSMKEDLTYVLPGQVSDAGLFNKTKDGLQVTVDGKKMLEAMDSMIADDKLMAQIAQEGEDPAKGKTGKAYMMEKLFGKKGELRAEATGDLKPLFDYKAEMKKAADGQAEMLKKLQIELAPARPPMGGPGAPPPPPGAPPLD